MIIIPLFTAIVIKMMDIEFHNQMDQNDYIIGYYNVSSYNNNNKPIMFNPPDNYTAPDGKTTRYDLVVDSSTNPNISLIFNPNITIYTDNALCINENQAGDRFNPFAILELYPIIGFFVAFILVYLGYKLCSCGDDKKKKKKDDEEKEEDESSSDDDEDNDDKKSINSTIISSTSLSLNNEKKEQTKPNVKQTKSKREIYQELHPWGF
jgi:hypothetical protein